MSEKLPKPKVGATTVGAALKEVTAHSANLYITVGATQYYFAAAKNWRSTWEYKDVVEPVCGSQIPRVLTGHLDGKFEAEVLYTTDDLLSAIVTPDASTFELPEVTVTSVEKDVNNPQVTKTMAFTAKIFGIERDGPADGSGVVKLKFSRGIMTGAPTYS